MRIDTYKCVACSNAEIDGPTTVAAVFDNQEAMDGFVRDLKEACTTARLCSSGVFNVSRAERLLEEARGSGCEVGQQSIRGGLLEVKIRNCFSLCRTNKKGVWNRCPGGLKQGQPAKSR